MFSRNLAEVQKRLLRKQSYVALAFRMCCPLDLSPYIPISSTATTNMMIEIREPQAIAMRHLPLCSLPGNSAQRRVHFDDHDWIIPSTVSSSLSDDSDVDSTTWYRVEELEKFRSEARDMCREMKYHDELVHYADQGNSSDSESSSSSSSHRVPSLARCSLTRGLEQRTCIERQRRKYLSNRFLLKVAPKLYRDDPIKLAELARKCNAWATDLALEEASRDFTRVYLDDRSESVPPMKICRKRSVSSSDTEPSSKRMRTTA